MTDKSVVGLCECVCLCACLAHKPPMQVNIPESSRKTGMRSDNRIREHRSPNPADTE